MGGGAPHALYIKLMIEIKPKPLKIKPFERGVCTCNESLNDRMMARKMEMKAERHLSGLYNYMMALDEN